jgi:pyruvate formate lyase activating enzyme
LRLPPPTCPLKTSKTRFSIVAAPANRHIPAATVEHGIISNIQKYSVQDGPGIRTTVFLKGCPLDCWWCHNPEGRSRQPEVMVLETRCVRCGECVKVCPEAEDEELAEVQMLPPEACHLCGACVAACPTNARQCAGRRMSVDEVMTEILRDRIFYEESGGGVSFSGGEPLVQPAFVGELLDRCRARGLHAVLDTCGFAPTATFLSVAAKADLVLFDLKLMDEARHEQFTGVSNKLILANLQALDAVHQRIWARVPLIPGVNDHPENLEALAQFLRPLKQVRQVNLLPYHQTGLAKFARLGAEYRLRDTAPPSARQMAAAAAVLTAHGLSVKCGG